MPWLFDKIFWLEEETTNDSIEKYWDEKKIDNDSLSVYQLLWIFLLSIPTSVFIAESISSSEVNTNKKILDTFQSDKSWEKNNQKLSLDTVDFIDYINEELQEEWEAQGLSQEEINEFVDTKE